MAANNPWNLSSPQSFIPVAGSPILKWEEWSEYFRNYISAIEEEEELSAEKKYRILLHCLGPGGLKMFKNINKKPRQAGDGDLYKNALEDLDNYYRPRVCIAVDRYKFFHRKQGKEEPVEDYVSALKNLAINCRFGDLYDELIRDQIVMQSSNSNVQDNLWAKGESSLQEVIDIVKRAELTGRCTKEVLNENKREETIIARVKEKKHTKDFKKRSTGRTGIESKNFKSDDKKKCYRCGSYDHLANDKLCPAKKQKCLKCGIVGHFQKVCQRKNGGSKILDLEDTNSSEDDDLNMCILCINPSDEDTILCMKQEEKNRMKKPSCEIMLGVKNMVADFLSRMPLPSNDTDEFQNSDEDGKDDMWVAIAEEGVCNGIMRNEWNTEQNLDEYFTSEVLLDPYT
ncbi:hypothetical protein NDU88_003498 [Pleurodeles waltl]|uniref:CCHC-type domain-containing protein n=1 Tax=Pleurodeles waltl TaxID=8319 RepID=A0AAV7UCR8_PLEWA|nr:hypothetical protein NDU88_003498 [Pleurodeles waltl]